MTAIELPEVRLHGRTILRPGDLVRIDSGQARFRVQRLVQVDAGVEVHVYGGKAGRLSSRTFWATQVTRCRTDRDPNAGFLEALREAGARSKRPRR